MHFSLFIGQIIFTGIAVYLIFSKSFNPAISREDLVILMGSCSIGFAVAMGIVAFAMFKKKVEKISLSDGSISEKLAAYRASTIIRWAMLELPALFMIIFFLLTGYYMLLVGVAVLFLLFYFTKPTIAKVAQELRISEEEVM